jgi:ABC-type sugar transport system ATPase subunit
LGGAQAASEEPRPQRETLFEIQGLQVRGRSCPIVLHRGEILHLVDYDVREKQKLYRIVSGQQLVSGVSLQYEGHPLPQNWPHSPECYPITALDRFGAQGLFPQMSVAQNLIFPALRRLCGPFGLLDKGLEQAALKEWDRKKQLDGKNMAQLTQAQAIALQMESWILARRKVLILLEPFLHTDTASRSVLQSAFARFRGQGGAILVISSSRTSYLGISEQDTAAERWAPWYDRVLDVQEVCSDET